jgi:hypothetical protein
MAILVTLALAVVGTLMADEIKAWLPTMTQWLLSFAVKRLPEPERERRLEEWSADLQSFPEGAVKCLRAFDLSRASMSIRWSYRRGNIASQAIRHLRVWYLRIWLFLVLKTVSRLQSRLKVFSARRGLTEGSVLGEEASRSFVNENARIEMLILTTSFKACVRFLGKS